MGGKHLSEIIDYSRDIEPNLQVLIIISRREQLTRRWNIMEMME